MLAARRFQSSLAVLAVGMTIARAEAQRPSPVEHYRLRQKAQAALDQKQYPEAAAMFRRLAENDAWDGQLWLNYALASRAAGRTADAVEGAKKALALGAGYRPDMAYQIARGYATLGQKDSAYAWLDQSLAWQATPRTRLQTDSAFTAFRDEDRFRDLAGMLPRRHFSRDEGWRYDLAFLAGEARRLHASFRREAFSPEFEAAVRDLSARIPKLTDNQIPVEFQRLIVLLRDGHSMVMLPASAKVLPVDFYLFSDGLFIVGDIDSTRRLVGAKVERFGARVTDSIIAGLSKYVSRDNPMGIKWIGPPLLTRVDFVQALGGTDNPDRVTLTVRDPAGGTQRVTLEGGPARRATYGFKLPPPKNRPGETPLWLRDVPNPYWFTSIPEGNAVYFQFNQVRERPDETVAAFESRLREALSDPATKNLIVDVRHNSGGNSYLFPPLLRAMSYFEESAPDHKIYYIAGRNTFSAAQNFSTNVERLTRAVFVGEPTGSSPNFTGEGPILFDLPYSKVQVTISNWYHQFSFWNDTRLWIAPDIPVELSSTDYFANRDPALDAVLEVIRRSRGAIP
jgi:tetratricopeptide (TPR) repeat protein